LNGAGSGAEAAEATLEATLEDHAVSTELAWDRCYDFLNIFAETICEKLAFLTQNKAKLFKNLIITLVFEKNANFFAENCQKSLKIVIITSVP
jgi:hypothetical protein